MTSKKIIRIATRSSPLALWQANHVRSLIQNLDSHLSCQLVPLTTTGDRFLKDTVAALGGKGAFVKELEHALLNKHADIAVHSMKDVPANLPESLMIGAYLTREDPRDAFISLRFKTLEDLPPAAKIGTASLRRKAIIKHYRSDLQVETIRGNIQTRLDKLSDGNIDAIILAAAGLKRLGLSDKINTYFDTTQFIPAITQGILGVECSQEDPWIHELLAKINDLNTEKIALAERALNRKLGGTCHIPVAGFASLHQNQLHMTGLVADVEGIRFITAQMTAPIEQAETLGIQLAEKLLAQGADDILKTFL